MTDLSELIERVRGATGPDRALDRRIAAFDGWEHSYAEELATKGNGTGLSWKWQPGDWSWTQEDNDHPPLYTSNLDAAIALAERVLPGCDWQFCRAGEGTIIYGSAHHEPLCADGKAATVPLAICLAILTALKAQEDGREG